MPRKDEKHWRASVWWLERRVPERYGKRVPEAISQEQIHQIIEHLSDAIVEEIADEGTRERLLQRFTKIASTTNAEGAGLDQSVVGEYEETL